MAQCRHVPKGIVTNQPDQPLDLTRSHASISVCDRPECIRNAQRWVASETNETASDLIPFGSRSKAASR